MTPFLPTRRDFLEISSLALADLQRFEGPTYHVLGNHDTHIPPKQLDWLARNLGANATPTILTPYLTTAWRHHE